MLQQFDERLQPRFSRLHEERGLCHVALREAPQAIESLLRAVNLNPALPMAWGMLEGLYRLVGETANATTAAAHVATLRALPRDVVTGTSLFCDGDLAPGYEHRLLLHVWHDQPSRAAALEIAEKLVATALAAESAALAVTFRQHAGTDTVIDTKTGRARAAVTLRFFTEPTT